MGDMRDQPIQRIMTTPAWVIGPRSTLEEAARLMARERLHHLPVVDGDRLVGLVSASDLIGRDAPNAGRRPVAEVMQGPPVTLGRDSTLRDAAERLAGGDYHSLPVTDVSGRVIGVVTSTDLIRLLLDQLGTAEPRSIGHEALEAVRQAAELYLRSGHGEHEHAQLKQALSRAREQGDARLPTGRL